MEDKSRIIFKREGKKILLGNKEKDLENNSNNLNTKNAESKKKTIRLLKNLMN